MKSKGTTKDPLFRFFEREQQIGEDLLKIVKADLNNLLLVCDGMIKQTNHLRALLSSFLKGISS